MKLSFSSWDTALGSVDTKMVNSSKPHVGYQAIFPVVHVTACMLMPTSVSIWRLILTSSRSLKRNTSLCSAESFCLWGLLASGTSNRRQQHTSRLWGTARTCRNKVKQMEVVACIKPTAVRQLTSKETGLIWGEETKVWYSLFSGPGWTAPHGSHRWHGLRWSAALSAEFFHKCLQPSLWGCLLHHPHLREFKGSFNAGVVAKKKKKEKTTRFWNPYSVAQKHF